MLKFSFPAANRACNSPTLLPLLSTPKTKPSASVGRPKLSGTDLQTAYHPRGGSGTEGLGRWDSAHFEEGKAEYLLPQGLPRLRRIAPPAIWKTAKITYKKSAQDKAGTDIAAAAFVAFLPAGAEELTRLCMDDAALELIGGKGKGFPAQIELMSAVVKAYGSNPAMAPQDKSSKMRCAAVMTSSKAAPPASMSSPKV